jgi:hypothetical protein
MVSLTPHSHEKALAPKHSVLTTIPIVLCATVYSFCSLLKELVAPIANPVARITLLRMIRDHYLLATTLETTMTGDSLRKLYHSLLGVPEEGIPTEAIDRLYQLPVPHRKDHINAIKEFIANSTGIPYQVAVRAEVKDSSGITADSPPDAAGNGSA